MVTTQIVMIQVVPHLIKSSATLLLWLRKGLFLPIKGKLGRVEGGSGVHGVHRVTLGGLRILGRVERGNWVYGVTLRGFRM